MPFPSANQQRQSTEAWQQWCQQDHKVQGPGQPQQGHGLGGKGRTKAKTKASGCKAKDLSFKANAKAKNFGRGLTSLAADVCLWLYVIAGQWASESLYSGLLSFEEDIVQTTVEGNCISQQQSPGF